MPEARTYPHGVTCWIDSTQADVDAALRFYGGLFGWEFEEAAPPEAPVRYVIATLGGRDVAAVTGPADAPATWNTYVAVDDCDAAADTLQGLGGSVVTAPADAGAEGRAGRSATVVDREGAPLGLWQPRQRLGVQATNEPGAWNFSDLHTRTPLRPRSSTPPAFGWRIVDQGWGPRSRCPGTATTSRPPSIPTSAPARPALLRASRT